MRHKWVWLYPALLLVYCVYSYTQTDPNLVLSSHDWYWKFQQWAWQIGYHQRGLSTFLFLAIQIGLVGGYLMILRAVSQKVLSEKHIFWLIVACVAALLFSYPALSHDIFNYVFNAKMVLVYHANPHVRVALDYVFDGWTNFMHNTHTPAPYGYGFTGISLIPSLLGFGNLKLTVFAFRLFMVGSLASVLWLQRKIEKKVSAYELALFGLNPLILIEMIGNIHNDLIMMSMALCSVALVQRARKSKQWWVWGLAGLLFVFSVSIKFATIAMIGGIGVWWVAKLIKKPISFGSAHALALVTPLFTSRSQRFLPWYLSWSLTFIPFINERIVRDSFVVASFGALISYAPFLYFGEYTQGVLLSRTLLCFVPVTLYVLVRIVLSLRRAKT